MMSGIKMIYNLRRRKYRVVSSGGASVGALGGGGTPLLAGRPWRSLEPSTIASSLSSQMMVFSITNRDFTLAQPPTTLAWLRH
jgi:hypothetical protein